MLNGHSHFDEFVLYRALTRKFSGSHNSGWLPDEAFDAAKFRNVCAKLHPDLVDRLEVVISLLGMSKRDFIEIALIDALDRSEKTLDDVGALSSHFIEEGVKS